MIVITSPSAITNEISIIDSLFEEGLSLLHIRKPDFSELEMALFIHQIKLKFRANLVLHSHHELAQDFGINRIHFSEKQRNEVFEVSSGKQIISTSVHSIEAFNSLNENFEYAFVSPVFKSISKENYESKTDLFEALKSRTNFKTKGIALGGIDPENIQKVRKTGFDDVALLGAIWNHKNPVNQFKLCQQIAHTYSL